MSDTKTEEKKEPEKVRLDVGCGQFKKPGFIGIDICEINEATGDPTKIDIIHDLNTGIPFKDSEVDEIYASHFLEHIEDPYCFMKEIHRVCKNEALVEIYVPLLSIVPPNHRTMFYNDWFERNLDMEKWRVDKKHVKFKEILDGEGQALQNWFFELHIFLKVVK